MKNIVIAVFAAFTLAGCINGQGGGTGKASAVVVGVENGFAGKCDGALKDATDMTETLRPYSSNLTTLKDKQATASAVIAAMEKAVQSDLAIIYFSGHGGSQPSTDEFETDGRDEFICCYDTGVVDNRIWEVVRMAKGRVFFIFDCCHSETMFRSPGIKFFEKTNNAFKAGAQPKMLCWSGCPDSSYSYGSASGGEFTTALRKYASKDRTYSQVWKKISSDEGLKRHQTIRSTKLGDFDADNVKIFR